MTTPAWGDEGLREKLWEIEYGQPITSDNLRSLDHYAHLHKKFLALEAFVLTAQQQAVGKDLKLCNCDGFWHIEFGDGVTRYIDVSPVLDEVGKRLPNKKQSLNNNYQVIHNELLQEVTKTLEDMKKERSPEST